MIRVLHVIDRLKGVSGIARSILNYYENIDTKRVQFDFLVVDFDEDIRKMVNVHGGHVFKIDKLGLTNGKMVKRQLQRFCEKHKGEYDLVHSSFYQIDFMLFPIARKSGIKGFIAHSHNARYADYWIRSVRNWVLSKFSVKLATHYIACSELAAAFLFGKKRVKEGKIYILNNAIDAKRYSYNPDVRQTIRKDLGLKGKYVVGHVGRFNKQKNHQFLFELFMKYQRVEKNSVLLLAGEGEDQERFKELCSTWGISDRVLFLGARTDVPYLLQTMDCYVFPSVYEGLGISLIEAQAAGLPCIVSSSIPKESKVTENVVYLSLNDENKWIKHMKLNQKFVRTDTYDSIAAAGYDLARATSDLEDYYEKLIWGDII